MNIHKIERVKKSDRDMDKCKMLCSKYTFKVQTVIDTNEMEPLQTLSFSNTPVKWDEIQQK